MPKVTFVRVYEEAREVIEKNDPRARISKLPVAGIEAINRIIEKPNNGKVKNFAIKYDGKSISANNVKQTYVKFITKMCENENIYVDLKNKGWIFNESERSSSKNDYDEIGEMDAYVYTNCNIDLLIVKFVKVVFDAEGKDGLKRYVFDIEFSNNSNVDQLQIIDVSDIDPNYERGKKQLPTKETLYHINTYITSKGFTFDKGLIENYYLSLKSKPFVILAGTSGIGKTRLVRLFAEAIGATAENGRYKQVSVRPDWSDSSDLFGHVDLNGKFVPGAIIDFINEAEWDSDNPYFLCLDEMNLARVEYYLSDILSIIETREYKEERIITDLLLSKSYYGTDTEALEKYGEIRIPDNLYIVGTVNMDETTFPFSKKVLDRANTIEFSTVDFLSGIELPTLTEIDAMNLGNDFMKADYVFFQQCVSEKDYVSELCVELQEINKILEKANAHIGYRVRDEIVFYMLNNKNADLLSRDEAFDNEIMQKILPRIQGSSVAVKNMLCELFKRCAGEYESYQTESDDISSKMFRATRKDGCRYKKSAEKIAFMVRRFEEDGFTAYWL